jgi:hypothetical protein
MPGAVNERYFQEPLATKLEQERDGAREKRRLTYDWFNAVLIDGIVCCQKGHELTTRSFIAVLKGRSSATCQTCPNYDTEEMP